MKSVSGDNDPFLPGKVLWMTDTYGDHNGVSTVLKAVLEEIRSRDLPIDLLVCSNTEQSGDHLVVLKPVSEFSLPLYRHQPFRIPNLLAVSRVFRRGGYDRIICSTEGPMGFAALWLKRRYSAETWFYMHTDWMEFAKEAVSLEEAGLRRLQYFLRVYYRSFGRVFVLNSEHREWLTGPFMRLDPSKVYTTAHWVGNMFARLNSRDETGLHFTKTGPVLLYTGRISREKGVMMLPRLVAKVKAAHPGLQVVVAGTGPAEEELKKALPGALYLGWIDQDYLPSLYRAADLLVLPSRFDTFSCVVLEAMSCGLPVVAFNTKGPRDIIEHNVSGYLAEDAEGMAALVNAHLDQPGRQTAMRNAARDRAGEYRPERIMNRLLRDVGLELIPASL